MAEDRKIPADGTAKGEDGSMLHGKPPCIGHKYRPLWTNTSMCFIRIRTSPPFQLKCWPAR